MKNKYETMERIVKTYEVFNEQGEEWWEKGVPADDGDHQIFAPTNDPYDEETEDEPGASYINPDIDLGDDIDDEEWTKQELERELSEETEWYVGKLLSDGFSKDDILKAVQKYLSKK